MSYLIDTNIISELARGSKANAGVVSWIDSEPDDRLYISALVLAEIKKGIARLTDPERKVLLEAFYESMLARFDGRILPFTVSEANRWGLLCGEAELRGLPLPVMDSLIAATAMLHGFTVVTRNTKDFLNMPVAIHNPWT